jgi:osmotically-inducible protein OsmY
MKRKWAIALGAPLCALALQGCIETAAVAVGMGVYSAIDRRTTGAQVDDEAFDLRGSTRIRERFGDRVHVNVTSYNRAVMLTGEVPDEATKAEVERLVATMQGVRGVTNELQVAGVSAYSARASDAATTGKVKARFLDANRFNPVHVKVVTEAGTVYLMGIVTEREANEATELARTTSGVRKVVRVFEFCRPGDDACRPREAKGGEPKR